MENGSFDELKALISGIEFHMEVEMSAQYDPEWGRLRIFKCYNNKIHEITCADVDFIYLSAFLCSKRYELPDQICGGGQCEAAYISGL